MKYCRYTFVNTMFCNILVDIVVWVCRYYVQPQWVFDCVNNTSLLPMESYFPGATLPPHLSPFVEEAEGDYVPPERQALINRQLGLQEDSGRSQSSQS